MNVLPEMTLAAPLQRQSATIDCPRSMVGRVIGKGGDTIKALQKYTGALIQIDQSVEPTKVTISGTSESLMLAMSMVIDIVKGTFKGFALLRQLINPVMPAGGTPPLTGRPVYAPGYGLVPPVQVVNGPGAAPVTSTLLSSPSSSLDDHILSGISALQSPNKSLALQMPSVSGSLPLTVSAAFPTSSHLASLESPSSTLTLLRPPPSSAYAAPTSVLQTAPGFMSSNASLYNPLSAPPSILDQSTLNSLRGLYGKMNTATYAPSWNDPTQYGLTAGNAALSSLMGAPTSPTIGVSWDPMAADAAYYAQVTN